MNTLNDLGKRFAAADAYYHTAVALRVITRDEVRRQRSDNGTADEAALAAYGLAQFEYDEAWTRRQNLVYSPDSTEWAKVVGVDADHEAAVLHSAAPDEWNAYCIWCERLESLRLSADADRNNYDLTADEMTTAAEELRRVADVEWRTYGRKLAGIPADAPAIRGWARDE